MSPLQTATEGTKKAGDIQIQASDAVDLTNNSDIFSLSWKSATGSGGDVAINARTIAISGDGTSASSSIATLTGSQGNGGNLTLNATESININGGDVSVKTSGAGNTGNLTIHTGNGVNITNNGGISLFSNGSGSTGNLRIETGTLRVQNTAPTGGVTVLAAGSGNAGSISVLARDTVEVIEGRIYTAGFGGGTGYIGDITIETKRVNLREGGSVSASTDGTANAGNIVIRASESVDISGVSSNTLSSRLTFSEVSSMTAEATGNGGNVKIETPRLTLTQGGAVTTTSLSSKGNAGNITIRGLDVELDGFVIIPDEQFSENFQSPLGGLSFLSQLNSEVISSDADVLGGTITIDTERLRLSNGAQLVTSVMAGRGQGGNLVVRATDSIEITGSGGRTFQSLPLSSGLFTELQTGGIGSGGSISVETGRLNMSNGGQISTSTFNQGNAGDITIRADQIDLRGQNNTLIVTTVSEKARGNAGNLNITSDRLIVRDDAEVSSSTSGTGEAGNLSIRANQIEMIDGGSLFSIVGSKANGNGGTLSIDTDSLIVRDGAIISSSTLGWGQAGDIKINASNSVEVVGYSLDGKISSAVTTGTGGSGNAGRLNITTRRLSIRDGANVSTGAIPGSTGQGGNLTINASDWVEVVGTSNDGRPSFLTVRSRGEGQAGNITVNSPLITLKDKGAINAESLTADGGNITLNTNLLLLRRGGNISATAGLAQGAGNGGNIKINAKAIVTVSNENSDISANAFRGRGGNVTITTDALFGITPSGVPTSQSDITANSELGVQGQININQPDIQPAQGLIELPASVLDASNQINQNCAAPSGKSASSFYITGKGGLPVAPGNLAMSYYPTGEVRSVVSSDLSNNSKWAIAHSDSVEPSKMPDPIVEAQEIVKTADGEIMLVAQATTSLATTLPTMVKCPH